MTRKYKKSNPFSSLIDQLVIKPSMWLSIVVPRVWHGNNACFCSLIERTVQSQSKCKWKTLCKTRFHFIKIDIQLKCFSNFMTFSFVVRLIFRSCIHSRDIIRPNTFKTSAELFESFDRTRHCTTSVFHVLRSLIFDTSVVIDKQSTYIRISTIGFFRYIFIGT